MPKGIGIRGSLYLAVLFQTAIVQGFIKPRLVEVSNTGVLASLHALPGHEEAAEVASYVVVGNLQSGTNIGRIIRSATVFGAAELVVVGQKKFNTFGDHGTRFGMKTVHFYRPVDALAYLRAEKGATVLGIEIEPTAKPLITYDKSTGQAAFPFQGPTAFVFGNEGEGMSAGFRAICDDFV
jgi:tRNA G18 (ribose-2'-O)-methylase SpoU